MKTRMAQGNERFTEKFTKLVERKGLSRPALSSMCGVSQAAIKKYFEGSAPRPHNALLIADALEVDPLWLFDEDEPWRDDYPTNPAASIGDEALMLEAASRYAATERHLVNVIERAESIDWSGISEQLAQHDEFDEPSGDVAGALDVAKSLFLIVRNTIDQFDSVRMADYEHKLTRGYGRWLPEASNTRRQAFIDRIDAIFTKLTANDQARSVVMNALQNAMFIGSDPEAAFELAEDALQRCGIEARDEAPELGMSEAEYERAKKLRARKRRSSE